MCLDPPPAGGHDGRSGRRAMSLKGIFPMATFVRHRDIHLSPGHLTEEARELPKGGVQLGFAPARVAK